MMEVVLILVLTMITVFLTLTGNTGSLTQVVLQLKRMLKELKITLGMILLKDLTLLDLTVTESMLVGLCVFQFLDAQNLDHLKLPLMELNFLGTPLVFLIVAFMNIHAIMVSLLVLILLFSLLLSLLLKIKFVNFVLFPFMNT